MEGTCIPHAEPTSFAHGLLLIWVLPPCESLEHEGTASLWDCPGPYKTLIKRVTSSYLHYARGKEFA